MTLVVITLQDGQGELGQGVQINVQMERPDPAYDHEAGAGPSPAEQLAHVGIDAMRAHANAANSINN